MPNAAAPKFMPESIIEGKVQALLNRHSQNVPPIDPVAIAKGEGIEVRNAQFREPNVSGMLRRQESGQIQILVNESDPPVRMRYTIAHELGHALLHGDAGDFVDRERELTALYRLCEDEDADGSRKRREIQANIFAANLLMPRHLVQDAIRETEDVGELARIFNVSRTAIGFRIANLGL